MIQDHISNLKQYEDVLPSLKNLDQALYSYQEEMESFECNRKNSTLFLVKEGDIRIATTWREVVGGREVTGAVLVHPDEFVLFLPKEQYILKGNGKVLKYILE